MQPQYSVSLILQTNKHLSGKGLFLFCPTLTFPPTTKTSGIQVNAEAAADLH